MVLMAFVLMSCSKDEFRTGRGLDYEYGRDIPHDQIVLGERLQNPYTTENIGRALKSLYPTKADRVEVEPTNLYVRFLPADEAEFEVLKDMVADLMDHPLDFDVVREGDWYHDPQIEEGKVTWQYAVVPQDFEFPDIHYEIIDECYIAENDPATRTDGINWEEVEMESYRLTGNGDMIQTVQTKSDAKVAPSGRMTIVDEDYCGGKPIGIAGVQVSCNSFVKFARAYTDRDGYYKMDKTFSSKLRYRLVFKNEKGFSIGFNLILVPASVSTLGKSEPSGINMTVTKDSDGKLFRRSVVNNAAYDYISRCAKEDMNLTPPPSDLRIWIFNFLECSSAVMLHHGAVLESKMVSSFLGKATEILAYFMPDLTIGTKGADDYKSIYSSTSHELAHSSHFAKVGTDYWDEYIYYIVESYIKTGGMTYGEGIGERAGYCEVGEMWAYYLESKIYKERYGGSFPTFGTSFWFYPQIFRYLDERGMDADDFLAVMDKDVKSKADLKDALMLGFPSRRNIVEQVFSRY